MPSDDRPILNASPLPAVWVGYCVRCLGQRWMTDETKNDPCGLCLLAEQRREAPDA